MLRYDGRRMCNRDDYCEECTKDRVNELNFLIGQVFDEHMIHAEFEFEEGLRDYFIQEYVAREVDAYMETPEYILGLESDADKKAKLAAIRERSPVEAKKYSETQVKIGDSKLRWMYRERQQWYEELYGVDERFTPAMLSVRYDRREEIYKGRFAHKAQRFVQELFGDEVWHDHWG